MLDTAGQGEEGSALVRKAMASGEPYALAFIDSDLTTRLN